MALRLVGAGLGRTGTHSLKIALEQLLGAPCYHMIEVFGHPEHIPVWTAAMHDDMPDWDAFFDGYAAAVDWPSAACWESQAAAFPDAPILLSTRSSPEAWWKSADQTIAEVMRRGAGAPIEGWQEMAEAMFDRFTPQWNEPASAMAAYEAHNAHVRANAPAGRLVEWKPGDGWEPLCSALGVPVPAEPFPHVNTTEDFRAMAGLDEPSGQ